MEKKENIKVIISNQVFSADKYFGAYGQNCYLKEALIKDGRLGLTVGSYGLVFNSSISYQPKEPFNCDIVEAKLEAGEDIEVELILV